MEKLEKPEENQPIPQKPEIGNPSLKERIEILKEKNEFDKEPMKENIEKPELPKIPEEIPEEKPHEKPKENP
jgi:hypothetical protein